MASITDSGLGRPAYQRASTSPSGAAMVMRWLRIGSLVSQLLVIAAADWLYQGQLDLGPLLFVTGCYAAWIGWFLLLSARTTPRFGRRRLFVEIAVDLIVLTALFYFAGGWTNPFVSVYLIPVAVAALVLERVWAVAIALFAVALYALIVRFQVPLPSVHGRFGGDFNLHVFGMWLSFVISTCVLVMAVSMLRGIVERQRAALAREREARLRDEQLVALGALAATTAHELGTPLSTARLIADELQEAAAERSRIDVLSQQLDYAITKLKSLVRIASGAPADEVSTPADLLVRVADRFATLRPEIELEQHFGELPALQLGDTRLLEGTLLALLVNAANASAQAGSPRVVLSCRADARHLLITIRDFGAGIGAAPHGLEAVASERGLGVGLVISSATIERYGGRVEYSPRDPGTEVNVSLPLSELP